MTLIERINDGIKEAIRGKLQLRLDTLRMLKSRILAVDARAALPDPEVVKLFKTYLGNLQEALEIANTANRPEMAERLKCEIAIVLEFLPKVLSPEETKELVLQAISESGAKTKKDLGLVMKTLMKLSNAVDGKTGKRPSKRASHRHMMTLEEQVQAYRDLVLQISDLEEKKRELSLSIFQQMTEKVMSFPGYTVRRYERLSFKTPLEVARELGATKTQEVLDKDALKKLHESGHTVPGVTPCNYVQVSPKKSS